MYALLDMTPFHFNIAPATEVADFPPMYAADGVTLIPYKREETVSISTKFKWAKSYTDTWKTIFHAVYDTLDLHVHDASQDCTCNSSRHSRLEKYNVTQ